MSITQLTCPQLHCPGMCQQREACPGRHKLKGMSDYPVCPRCFCPASPAVKAAMDCFNPPPTASLINGVTWSSSCASGNTTHNSVCSGSCPNTTNPTVTSPSVRCNDGTWQLTFPFMADACREGQCKVSVLVPCVTPPMKSVWIACQAITLYFAYNCAESNIQCAVW